jgi:hypothetical protein
MTVPSEISSATAWPGLCRLFPIYSALARESVIDMPPCPELQEALPAPSADAIAKAETWFAAMDKRIQPHQLRQFLQNSGPMDGDFLQQLLSHHLNQKEHSELDRDKVDFLLVQFFSQRAASDVSDSDLSFQTVAQALQPVLGAVEGDEPEWLAPVTELLSEASSAQNLNWLLTARIIERGRDIKHSCGEKFFEPAPLAAFARFGFLIRRRFFRLMHQDLNATLDGLRDLESRGVTSLDCRKAQFSAHEPVARLRMICQSWKVMFHAEYSSGQPLCILVDLRTTVEAALAQTQKPGESQPQLEPRTAKAAAGVPAGASAAGGSAPEFEVAVAPSTWDGDAAG